MLYCLWSGRCSGALGGASLLPLQCPWLLAAQGGTGAVGVGHAQTSAVLVLGDHVPDAAEGGPSLRVDVCPHVGGGWLSLARSPLHDDHHTSAVGPSLQVHILAVNQRFIAEGVAGFHIVGLSAVCRLVPSDQDARAVARSLPLQMREHGDSASPCSSGRQKGQLPSL